MGTVEVFEHTADVGLRVRGRDLEELFRTAAEGLFDSIVVNREDIRDLEREDVTLAAETLAELLAAWLNELIFRCETRHRLYTHFDVHLSGRQRRRPESRRRDRRRADRPRPACPRPRGQGRHPPRPDLAARRRGLGRRVDPRHLSPGASLASSEGGRPAPPVRSYSHTSDRRRREPGWGGTTPCIAARGSRRRNIPGRHGAGRGSRRGRAG